MKLLSNTILFTFVFLTACAIQPSQHNEIKNGVKIAPTNVEMYPNLLDFYSKYSNANLETQKQLLNQSETALTVNPNDLMHKIKLATMLALPSSQLRDTTKAQVILSDLIRDNNTPKRELAFAELLYEYTQDNNKLQQKLRDESKKVEAAQKRNEALQNQITELKNIEKTLNARDTKSIENSK